MDIREPSQNNTEQGSKDKQLQQMLKKMNEVTYEAEQHRIAIFNRDLKNPPRI